MGLLEFSNRNECEDALNKQLIRAIDKNLATQKRVVIALAGGNTPKPLYEKLSQAHLDWSRVMVTLTDERWVDSGHDDSNERMLKACFFKQAAKMALFIGLKNSEKSADVGQIRTAHLLKQNISKLDYVVLGMGSDGHFASIFPNMKNTGALLDLNQTEPCLAAYPDAKSPRISLTFQYLLKAKRIFLLITGQEKRAVVNAAMESKDTALPIYHLLHQSICPVDIYWSES